MSKLQENSDISSLTKNSFYRKERLKHTYCILNVLKHLPKPTKRILDAMAGEGYLLKELPTLFPDSKLYANDLSENCYLILKKFKGVKVFNLDFLTMESSFLQKMDLIIIDFNTFSILHYDKWELKKLKKIPNICVTDTASFGMHFEKNRKVYDVENLEEYYLKLAKKFGKHLIAADHHKNAGCVLLSKTEKPPKFLYKVKSLF